MELTRQEYVELLETYGMWGWPRRCGTPFSVVMGNPSGFFRWFDANYGEPVPLYVSHNAHPPRLAGEFVDSSRFVFKIAFGDFDTGDNNNTKPEEVMAEVVRVSHWLIKENRPFGWKYSGSDGGFHCHVKFEEEVRKREDLAVLESTFWRGLARTLTLQSINIRCANPTCMERLPFTPYVHKKSKDVVGFKKEANYCVPVPWEMILKGDLKAIKDLSFHPKLLPLNTYFHPGKLVKIDSVIREKAWVRFNPSHENIREGPVVLPTGKMADLMKLYIPNKLCLQQLIFEKKPGHTIRLAWISEIFRLDPRPSLQEAIALSDRVAEEAQWENRQNVQYRHSQVEQAWRAGYHSTSCETIMTEGQCLGKKCPRYKYAFPEDTWKDENEEGAKDEGS